MTATPRTTRLGAALAATLSLAACGGRVDFTISRTLAIDSTVDAGAASSSFDLATEAGSAWKERSHISSVSVQSAEATVTAVDPANTATAVGGTVWLLPEGATDPSQGVEAGHWSDEPVAVGHLVALQPSAALDDFVTSVLKGSGRFVVMVQGTGAGGARVACTLHVTLAARLTWRAP